MTRTIISLPCQASRRAPLPSPHTNPIQIGSSSPSSVDGKRIKKEGNKNRVRKKRKEEPKADPQHQTAPERRRTKERHARKITNRRSDGALSKGREPGGFCSARAHACKDCAGQSAPKPARNISCPLSLSGGAFFSNWFIMGKGPSPRMSTRKKKEKPAHLFGAPRETKQSSE